MSMQVKSAQSLHKFFCFAGANRGNKDAIARFSKDGFFLSRMISATNRDRIRGVFHWGRTAENEAANNQIRQHFILNVLTCLGWNPAQGIASSGHALTKSEIKNIVKTLLPGQENKARRTALLDALIVRDYGCGKPLTARRINAVLEQVESVLTSRKGQGVETNSILQALKKDPETGTNSSAIEKINGEFFKFHKALISSRMYDAANTKPEENAWRLFGDKQLYRTQSGQFKKLDRGLFMLFVDRLVGGGLKWNRQMLEGNLDEIAGAMKDVGGNNRLRDVDDCLLKEFLRRFIEAYNEYQVDSALRIDT